MAILVDLPYLYTNNVNDDIPRILCGLYYFISDNVIQKILEVGTNTLLKLDIKNAFRLLLHTQQSVTILVAIE